MSEPPAGTPSLYEWAGGSEALGRLLDCFYDAVERDELISPFFPGGVGSEHRANVTAWWCEVFGGPAEYTERLGGYESMLAHHRDLAITPEQRRRFVSLLSAAADEAELPDDPEFRSALVAYAEWGTRLAMHNSQPGAEVAEHAPVPRWGWGEAPPFRPKPWLDLARYQLGELRGRIRHLKVRPERARLRRLRAAPPPAWPPPRGHGA